MERACIILSQQQEWCSRLLPSLIISLHEFGAMFFTCLLIIIVHADHHHDTWEIIIIIIVFHKQNLWIYLREPSLSIIPCYAFFSYVRRLQVIMMIIRWELCSFGGFRNTSWLKKLWPNFKETKQIAKIVVATINPWGWVFLLSLVYPSKNVILFFGFPTVTRSVT